MPTHICKTCHKSFDDRRETAIYCSQRCYHISRKKSVTLICQFCERPYQVKPFQVKDSKYCSYECSYTGRNSKIILICDTCNKSFRRFPSQSHAKYCSPECFYKSGQEYKPRIETECRTCGKPMRVTQAKLDSDRGRFCSKECVNRGRLKSNPTPKITLSCAACGKTYKVFPSQKEKARFCSHQCRVTYQGSTSIEQLLIDELDKRDVPYQFQYKVKRWIVDFAFPAHNLVVEADGDYWHTLPEIQKRDKQKNRYFQKRGWTILRFSRSTIRESPKACVDQILTHLTLSR